MPNPQDIEFLNDIRIYDVDNLCWFGVRARGGVDGEGETTYNEEPEGRYGVLNLLKWRYVFTF